MKPKPPPITRLWGLWPTGDFGPFTFYTTHKRKRVVAFPKAPPKTPPTWKQNVQRFRFTCCARAWSWLPAATRHAWTTAARRARLTISGFNLWMYSHLKEDFAPARTIEHQSGVNLDL